MKDENKILPPDNFNALVMDRVEKEEIKAALSPQAAAFALISGALALLCAVGLNSDYFRLWLKNEGLYAILGRYTYMLEGLASKLYDSSFITLCISAAVITAGVYIFVSEIYGVRKNGQ